MGNKQTNKLTSWLNARQVIHGARGKVSIHEVTPEDSSSGFRDKLKPKPVANDHSEHSTSSKAHGRGSRTKIPVSQSFQKVIRERKERIAESLRPLSSERPAANSSRPRHVRRTATPVSAALPPSSISSNRLPSRVVYPTQSRVERELQRLKLYPSVKRPGPGGPGLHPQFVGNRDWDPYPKLNIWEAWLQKARTLIKSPKKNPLSALSTVNSESVDIEAAKHGYSKGHETTFHFEDENSRQSSSSTKRRSRPQRESDTIKSMMTLTLSELTLKTTRPVVAVPHEIPSAAALSTKTSTKSRSKKKGKGSRSRKEDSSSTGAATSNSKQSKRRRRKTKHKNSTTNAASSYSVRSSHAGRGRLSCRLRPRFLGDYALTDPKASARVDFENRNRMFLYRMALRSQNHNFNNHHNLNQSYFRHF